ncbi:GIY-YIG nuclease family protein [Candidatus Kaiserbacteria bacterium]|nr:GIY-YIG nuclease family protein [Candidatus Kaiserbacteria bacterium]
MYFVYILECADGSLYTGITTDVARRFAEHQAGTASHYTSARGAVRICYSESQPTRSAALIREAAIKRLSREKKQELISLASS